MNWKNHNQSYLQSSSKFPVHDAHIAHTFGHFPVSQATEQKYRNQTIVSYLMNQLNLVEFQKPIETMHQQSTKFALKNMEIINEIGPTENQ